MILCKTKYYGLLGDRVRQAIKESGRESSKFREMMRGREGKKLTSDRTLDNFAREMGRDLPKIEALEREQEALRTSRKLDKEYYLTRSRLRKQRNNKIREEAEKNGGSISQQRKDEIRAEYDKKLDINKIYEPDDKLTEKLKNIKNRYGSKQAKLEDLLNENDKILESRNGKYFFNNNKGLISKEYNKIIQNERQNLIDKHNQTYQSILDDNNKNAKIRKNPNDSKIIEDVKKDFLESGGKEENWHSVPNNMESRGGGLDNGEMFVEVGSNPAIAAHEVNHAKHFKNGNLVRKESINVLNQRNIHNRNKYTHEEEGEANKAGFRKVFLSKHSGGRDWRTAARVTNMSNRSYHAALGIDINKSGMQDLGYNMSPEALKKLKENAKNLGIDLDKKSNINKVALEDQGLTKQQKFDIIKRSHQLDLGMN